MTADSELDGWREEWQAQKVVMPEVSPVKFHAGLPPKTARTHVEFLDDELRRMRFRFWKRSERSFLADLRAQLKDEDVRAKGLRMRRRRRMRGGFNV